MVNEIKTPFDMICEICLFENKISLNSKVDDSTSNVNFYSKEVDI
jgi:hypothetical protein